MSAWPIEGYLPGYALRSELYEVGLGATRRIDLRRLKEKEAAPGVHPAKARRIAANIAKLPELLPKALYPIMRNSAAR